MAGISEIYTTKAMLDSQMVHIGKQVDMGTLELSSQDTEHKLRRASSMDMNFIELL